MILATGGVHAHLVAKGLRSYVSIIVRSAECLDTHYFAVLVGVGATAVNAYLAQESFQDRLERGLIGDKSLRDVCINFKTAIEGGLLKIISKMGISVISSYRGGYNFEAVGLSRALAAEFFPGMPSRISGIGLAGIESKAVELHRKAWGEAAVTLPVGGLYKLRRSGEAHAFEARLIHTLQSACDTGDFELYRRWSNGLRTQKPIQLRDLLDWRSDRNPISTDDVESVNEIRKRFVTPGMSLGALGPEAHGALNIAMNRIGAKSVSGEGGEDSARYKPLPNGDNPNSAIKQVASGRFGVTAEYLNQCVELEIKVAQGAKPGEGGQLPGFKVTEMIARLRHATPGVMLISPPPHHDIYSIEDLAQLIYDLKQINPVARVTVKLVAATGIGAIAAGVAKAKADVILVAGGVGGTGASSQTSVKYAGGPWEMGLSEANQVLTLNNLRHSVVLRADGGMRTGRDIVIAAMLGAEEFGIGTASLVAMGCIMVRQCHSNTCPVGVCTQDEALRAKFTGTPDKVINLFSFIAEEVREILAGLGFKSLLEIVGRTDLLAQVSRGGEHLDDLDLNPLLVRADPGNNKPYNTVVGRNAVPDTLDAQIVRDAAPLLERGEKMQLTYTVRSTARSIGSRTSSHIVRKFGMKGLPSGHLTVQLKGSAGQSLGAFAVQGLRIELTGEANDYVGKGLSGATIVIKPARGLAAPETNTLIGNTVLFGATSGRLFAAGQAGERFAVRNSGATTVVEGCGANGCEYMTGGQVVILGPTGGNFGAGMTGGMAFVLDQHGRFEPTGQPGQHPGPAPGLALLGRRAALAARRARPRDGLGLRREPAARLGPGAGPVLAGLPEGNGLAPAAAAGGGRGGSRAGLAFARYARSRSRLRPGGLDRGAVVQRRQAGLHSQSGRSADGRPAVRLVLRLCRRPGRDRRPGLAGQARRQPAAGTIGGDRGPALGLARRGSTVDRGVAGRSGPRRPLGAVEADDRRPSGRRVVPPGQAGLRQFRWRRNWRDRGGLARAGAALWRSVRLAGRTLGTALARRAGPFQAGDAGPADRRGGRLRQARPRRLRRRMEVGRHPRPGGQRARRAAALHPHRRRHLRRFPRRGRGPGLRRRDRRRTAGPARRRPGSVRRPAAAAEPQDGR
jgi:glutamate synthase domain-containing protein 2/glutamate synthase domain-containing protein 3